MSHLTFWVAKVAQLRHLGAGIVIPYDNGLFLHRSTCEEFSSMQMPSFDFMGHVTIDFAEHPIVFDGKKMFHDS